jgi:membrane-bound serine protease (ClpP class)
MFFPLQRRRFGVPAPLVANRPVIINAWQGDAAMKTMLSTACCVLLLALLAGTVTAQQPTPAGSRGLVIEVKDAIGPATKEHFLAGLEQAEEQGLQLVVLVLDTPGGLDAAMRDMIQGILNSRVPVATFVAPSGARAASAGTYILYASHVAAMAPGTNLGAATPVAIGGAPQPDAPREKDGEAQPQPGTAMERKAVNDAVAYIRSLAEMRGRNVDWAEASVRGAASLPAQEALEQGVIDLVADDVPALLAQLDGRELTAAGTAVSLNTAGMVLETFEPTWRTELLAVITNPLIAYGLLIVGLYGLMFEGYNPGAILPGVIGAICLLLGLYALQVLSVNYAGLALVGLGLAMMIAEVFVPSFGALGVGGLAAFVIGSIILMDTDAPGFGVPVGLIGGIAAVAGITIFGTVWLAARARRKPVTTGEEQLAGATAVAAEDFTGRGRVRVFGEEWAAVSALPVSAGQRVTIERVEGLLLHVRPQD